MEHLGMMSNTCSQENGLPPGFRFHPTDEELVTYYLTTKVLDNSFSGRAIAEVDLNKCEPWDLPDKAKMGEKEWYFFSLRDRKYPTGLRTNRATEAGYWKATGKDREVFNTHTRTLAGMKKTLVFYKGRAPRGEKTNWVMHEYRLEGTFSYQHLPKASKDEWVVCRIFHKNAGGGLRKSTSGLLMNRNLYIDDVGSPSLPPLLESPTYTTRTGQNEETELSDIASIMRCATANPHNSNNSSSYMMLGDPQFNMNMRPADSLSQLSNLNVSQLPSMVANAGFPGVSSHVGLPSIAILRALVDQYSGCNDFGLKQCKMEPSASPSFGGQQDPRMNTGIHDINLRMSQGQWIDKTQQNQQLINVEDDNGVGSQTRPPAETNNMPQETDDGHSMNAEMSPVNVFDRSLNRSYQVDPDSTASAVDLDSLWAYSPHIMHNLSHHEGDGM